MRAEREDQVPQSPRHSLGPANEQGQALILLMLGMTVIFVVGILAVDVGLWLSEKRGAQSDSDFSALAGAQAYLTDQTNTNGAFDDAVEWAIDNGVDPATIDGSPTSTCARPMTCIDVGIGNCREDGSDSAMPWVEANVRHESVSLFFSIFGIGDPDIGASARACVGSPQGMTGLSPFGIQTSIVPPNGPPETGAQCFDQDSHADPIDSDNDGVIDDGCARSDCLELDPNDPSRTRPIYGGVCIMKMGGPGGVTGQRGQLTLSDVACSGTSTNLLRHNFHYGSQGFCTLGEEVNTGTGAINGLVQGLEDRLNDEGKCDDLFGDNNGYDNFEEVFSMPGSSGGPVVPSADAVFSENPCSVTAGVDVPPDPYHGHNHTFLPRGLHLILIDELEPNAQTATITGFAGFYPIGCFSDNTVQAVKAAIEADLTDFGTYLNRCAHPTGQDVILGVFVQTLQPPADVSDPDPNLPISIVLVK
jgi:hypothetical protein